MLNKLVFFALSFCFLIQSCDSSSPKQASADGLGLKTDTVPNTNSSQKSSTTLLSCSDVLARKGVDDMQKIYSDTMTFDQSKLLFVTRDSALSVFRQKNNDCVLLPGDPGLFWIEDGNRLGREGGVFEPDVGESRGDPLVQGGVGYRVDARAVVLALEVDGIDSAGCRELGNQLVRPVECRV